MISQDQVFKVPIRNLFCLLSYINDMPEFVKSLNELDEDLITYDFIANRFLMEVDAIRQRGFVKNFIATVESTSRLGGRLLMNESMPYIIGKKPVVVCEKDQYTANVLLNQVVKSTLRAISVNRYVKEQTRKRSFSYLDFFPEVDTVPLTKEMFMRIYFERHTLHYKRVIHIARLLHDCTLLSHKSGNWSLFSAELDESSLNHLFEKFFFNFYRVEQDAYRVQSETMQWGLEGNQDLLPSMRTDISLTHKLHSEKVVIDAKFYKHVFQEYYGRSSFHSHNMYQMFTYLMHQSKELEKVRGVLIYPYNGLSVDEVFRWDERMTMEIITVNLDASWQEIHERLICLVG